MASLRSGEKIALRRVIKMQRGQDNCRPTPKIVQCMTGTINPALRVADIAQRKAELRL
jgi:hypothetical protein